MKIKKTVDYILSFLLGEDEKGSLGRYVAYVEDLSQIDKTLASEKLIIVASSFFRPEVFGTPSSLPSLPLSEWEGIPLLFGEARTERQGDKIILYADVIASSYFLLSRYEEMCKRGERDALGRFMGQWSLPYKAGFLHRPIVDEYAEKLADLLRSLGVKIKEKKENFARINLTHDIDLPYKYQGLRSFLRAILKEKIGIRTAFRYSFRPLTQDPYFNFKEILELNEKVKETCKNKCSTIFFYKTPSKEKLDRPCYSMRKGVGKKLREAITDYQVVEELHLNIACSKDPRKIKKHTKLLGKELGKIISKSRYHYLACQEPEDFLTLPDVGILGDYSMGYADMSGFRLGTCRPVRFILPATGRITALTLHPLTLMDCTLSREDAMNLDREAAQTYAKNLLWMTAKYNGELNLLFHNNLLVEEEGGYLPHLYKELLDEIVRIETKAQED